jgi:hypothetical protein
MRGALVHVERVCGGELDNARVSGNQHFGLPRPKCPLSGNFVCSIVKYDTWSALMVLYACGMNTMFALPVLRSAGEPWERAAGCGSNPGRGAAAAAGGACAEKA